MERPTAWKDMDHDRQGTGNLQRELRKLRAGRIQSVMPEAVKEEFMTLFRKIPFRFAEKDYEIRVYYDDRSINVVAFLNNYPANGYRHLVKIPKRCNVKKVLEKHTVEELIETSRNEIIEGRWETLSKAIRESEINDYT
jgi:hypothetical protein